MAVKCRQRQEQTREETMSLRLFWCDGSQVECAYQRKKPGPARHAVLKKVQARAVIEGQAQRREPARFEADAGIVYRDLLTRQFRKCKLAHKTMVMIISASARVQGHVLAYTSRSRTDKPLDFSIRS